MRRVLIITAVLVLGAGAVFAQSAEQQIVGIENGVLFAYNLNTDDLGVGQETAINLSLTDSIQAGFVYIDGDGGTGLPDHTLLRLSYLIQGGLGMNVSAGLRGGNPAAGVGIFANVFSQTFQDTLFTALGLRVDYLTTTAVAVTEGVLTAGLSVKIGM
ncbi:MAG: hypothetical protein ACOC2Y_09750 [Spirochaetota bacterium]